MSIVGDTAKVNEEKISKECYKIGSIKHDETSVGLEFFIKFESENRRYFYIIKAEDWSFILSDYLKAHLEEYLADKILEMKKQLAYDGVNISDAEIGEIKEYIKRFI